MSSATAAIIYGFKLYDEDSYEDEDEPYTRELLDEAMDKEDSYKAYDGNFDNKDFGVFPVGYQAGDTAQYFVGFRVVYASDYQPESFNPSEVFNPEHEPCMRKLIEKFCADLNIPLREITWHLCPEYG